MEKRVNNFLGDQIDFDSISTSKITKIGIIINKTIKAETKYRISVTITEFIVFVPVNTSGNVCRDRKPVQHRLPEDAAAASKECLTQTFSYEPSYSSHPDSQEMEVKQLLSKLRNTMEGKVIDYDTYDTNSDNTYTQMVIKNMRNRLSACLRENLELRVCKAVYEKSQEISDESEEYLRKVILDVLETYIHKGKNSKSDR